MKVAIITDTHFGCRVEGDIFFNSATRFYRNVFFPEIEKRGIRTVVHLGDLMHRQKFVAAVTLNRMRTDFIDPITDRGLELIIFPGNHDVTYKTSLRVNWVRELLPVYPGIKIIERPQVWNLGDLPVLMMPWICRENEEISRDLIKGSNAPALMGHLELSGFYMYRGIKNESKHAMGASSFDCYRTVMSGHFHHKSDTGNVHYLGAPYEMEWPDHDDDRGFHIFDTSTMELEFIRNPERLHVKMFYDGRDDSPVELARDKIVKLIVRDRSDVVHLDKYVKSVLEVAATLDVVNDHKHLDLLSSTVVMGPATSTLSLLLETAKGIKSSVDKDRLNSFLVDLYKSAEAANI